MSTPQAALQELEASFAEIGPQLKADAPDQHARMLKMIKALKAGKAGSAEVKDLVLELARWQLGLQKEAFEDQLAQFAPAIAKRVPAALESEKALKAVIRVLEESIKAADGKAPSPKVVAGIEKAAIDAQRAVERAEKALSQSTLGVPMKPVLKQPVSASGVRLKPVEPARPQDAKPAPLESFKLRPGTVPPRKK